MNTVGDRIKTLRTEAGITQLQLADFCGCSGQVISNIERGYSKPASNVLNKIAECLKVPSDYILGLTKSQYASSNPYISDFKMHIKISEIMRQQICDIDTFASSINIDVDEARRILNGTLKPNIDTLSRIADTLHTTIDYLIGNTEFHIRVENEDEQDLISYYRNMTKSQKRVFFGEIEKLLHN